MYLKELRLNGFKSFADNTRLRLEPGVTAIVGPNGCGKSNLADAIRWVLGEQSAKSLRGGSMQDVIFQGTDRRGPMGLCEVSLVFADCAEALGTAHEEVEITRRVQRDGGSNYYINGVASRLRDIQRLFLDTGVGQVSYSFLVQGQIDKILSSNPAERRTIFEEAAGISKYKAQRKEALNKLALVDTNLARVTDVVEEVSRQIGSLRRQALRALRYKRLSHRLRHLDLARSAHRHHALATRLQGEEEAAGKERAEVEALQKQVGERESALESRREVRTGAYEALQGAQQRVYDLRSEKENAEGQAGLARMRAEDARGRAREIEEELARLEEQKEKVSQQLQGESESRREHEGEVSASDSAFQSRAGELSQAQETLQQAEADLQRLKQDLLVTESGVTRLRSNCTSLEVEGKSGESKLSDLAGTLAELESRGEALASEREELQQARARKEKDREAAEAALQEARASVEEKRTAFRSAQQEVSQADRALAQESARLGVLENLQKKLEGLGEGARAIALGKLADILPAEEARPLLAGLQVEEAWTSAVETLLGPAAEAVVLDQPQKAGELIEALHGKALGRAALTVPVSTPVAEEGEAPTGLTAASSVVSSADGTAQARVRRLLQGCYLCDSLNDFLALWQTNPEMSFRAVATCRGELIDARGVVYGGRSAGKPESFLQRENEIRALKKSRAQKQAALDHAHEASSAASAALEEAEGQVEERRRLLAEVQEELSVLRSQEKSAAQSAEENTRSREARQKEREELSASQERARERLQTARKELETTEARIGELRGEQERADNAVTQAREKRDQMRENLADVRLQLAERKQRLEMIDKALREGEEQRRGLEERRLRALQEKDELASQEESLEQEAKAKDARAAEIEGMLRQTMSALEKSRGELQEADQAITALEKELRGERERLHGLESTLNKREVSLAREKSEAQFLLEEIRREYDEDLAAIEVRTELWRADRPLKEKVKLDLDELGEDVDVASLGEYDSEAVPPEEELSAYDSPDWEAIGGEVSELRGKLNAIGPVNLVAIEEYAQLRERHDFLKSQSEDLWSSKEELLKAIDEINETSRQLFEETFEQIRKNFAFTFENLFGGGEADLRLMDADDVLETGIEITARPPGTRLKSLALLSGGQKTMTAVGLLFAIYMVKPSPFCMLDELDAPLDDANIGRFTKMLERFTRYSQFVIITHNKRTVAAASAIYGVTMQEKGVSKVVSMKFNARTNRTEATEGAATEEAAAASAELA